MVSHGHIYRRSTLPTLMCTNTTTIELLRTTSVSCFSPRPSGQTKTEALSKTILFQLFSFSKRLDQLVAPVPLPQQDEVLCLKRLRPNDPQTQI